MKNIAASHSNIVLDQIDTKINYEKMQNQVAFGSMQILSWLVFLFGVINLINTTLSNQMARKQENSILRSAGLSVFVCSEISIGSFGGNVAPYQFPVREMGLFILVLFGMELILSGWTIRRRKKAISD